MAQAIKFLLIALCAALTCGPAAAQEFVSKHGDWLVFTVQKGGSKVCYIASEPVKKTGDFGNRSEPYLLVTSRNATTDEVSVSSGYPYKVDSKVKVEVDSNKFEFFTKDILAWAYDAKQDAQVVGAMKKGNRLTVRGTSQKDTFSLDTYSLKGVSAAYNAMKAQCK